MFLCVKGEGNKTLYSYLLDYKDRNSRQIQKKSRIAVIKDEQVGAGLKQILKNYIFLLLLSNLYEWALGLAQYGTSHLASFKLLHQPMLPPLDTYDENFSCGSNPRTTWGKYFLPSLTHRVWDTLLKFSQTCVPLRVWILSEWHRVAGEDEKFPTPAVYSTRI